MKGKKKRRWKCSARNPVHWSMQEQPVETETTNRREGQAAHQFRLNCHRSFLRQSHSGVSEVNPPAPQRLPHSREVLQLTVREMAIVHKTKKDPRSKNA